MENNESQFREEPSTAIENRPEMSEAGTLLNIFFEPGRTFADLRKKPRFILGLILISLMSSLTMFVLYQKLGEDGVRTAINQEFDRNPQAASMPPEQRRTMIDLNMTIQKFMPIIVLVMVPIIFFIIALFYFLGAKVFGGDGGFLHAVSVVIYSSFPPSVLMTIASLIVLAFKATENIDLTSAQRGGLVQANPSMFIDGKAQPILAALLSSIDIFQIWGWILAAIGLRITNKLSSGSAWAIVIIFAVIGILAKVVGAMFS